MEENESKEKIMQSAENKSYKVEKVINLIVKTILNSILFLLGIIAIILIYNIIQISILNKPYMNIFGYTVFQVKTGSMSGTMEIGDIIVVKLTKEVKQNDIITFPITFS